MFQNNLMLYGIAGITAIIAAISQYGSRNMKRSICIIFIGTAMIAGTAFFSPQNVSPRPPTAETTLRLEPIRLGIDEISTSTIHINNQENDLVKTAIRINGSLNYNANVGPYYPLPKVVQSQFSFPGKVTRSFVFKHYSPSSPWISKQQLQAARALIPDWEIISEPHMEPSSIELGEFEPIEYESVKHEQGKYSGKVTIQWIQYRLLGQIPLRSGAQWNGQGRQVNIRSIQPVYRLGSHNGQQSNYLHGVTVYLENFYIDDYLKSESISTWGQFSNLRFLVAYPKNHKALISNGYGGSSMHFSPLSGLKVDNMQMSFHDPQTQNRPLQFNQDWLVSGILLIVEEKPCGTLTHEVTANSLSLNPKPSNTLVN
jgi:hypothetical protein